MCYMPRNILPACLCWLFQTEDNDDIATDNIVDADEANTDGMEDGNDTMDNLVEEEAMEADGAEEEAAEVDPGMAAPLPDELQVKVNYLIQRELCFENLEYGNCATQGCPKGHTLVMEDILNFYEVIRESFPEQLPEELRGKDEMERVPRLLRIYHGHKLGLSKDGYQVSYF